MLTIKKLVLPLFVAVSLGLSLNAAQAGPVIIPFELAQASPVPSAATLDGKPSMDLNNNGQDDLNTGKSDRPGDMNHNNRPDSQDNAGVNALGDNTNDMADGKDSKDSTFNGTFWLLIGLLIAGVIAVVVVMTRRKGTLN